MHPGQSHLRAALEDFHVDGPHGVHQCLVFPPLGMNLRDLRNLFEDRALEKTLLQRFLLVIVTALDFMHQAGVVHTGRFSIPNQGGGPFADTQARLVTKQHLGRG